MSTGTDSSNAFPVDPAERVHLLLEVIVGALGVDADVSIDQEDGDIHGIIDGEEVGLLIGRGGTTIDAIQFLCYRAAFRGANDRRRVTVDAGGYREQRQAAVEDQAERAAARALATGKEIELDPMSATERRVVHTYLAERSGVETFSEGDEPDRYVVVAPAVAAAAPDAA